MISLLYSAHSSYAYGAFYTFHGVLWTLNLQLAFDLQPCTHLLCGNAPDLVWTSLYVKHASWLTFTVDWLKQRPKGAIRCYHGGQKNHLIMNNSYDIWVIATPVVPLCSVYQVPSYEPNFTLLASVSTKLAYFSVSFILELACTVGSAIACEMLGGWNIVT